MTPQMKSVYSSHVQEIGWDEESGDLIVRFQNGKMVAYADVPEEVANRVMNSASIGEALHSDIKGQFDFRYI